MSRHLETAVDIADTVKKAAGRRLPLNVRQTAEKLARRHDEDWVSPKDIAAALTEESKAAGVVTV